MKRVIVTGAGGFIGTYVVNCMLKEGYDVLAIDRRPFDVKKPATAIISELGEIKSIEQADVLIHLAADISVPGDASTIANNVGGVLSVVELAKKAGVRHIIYLSSIPVIGEIVRTPIDENHPVRPRTPYHWSKYLGEQILDSVKEEFETITVLRIPSPVGAGMRKNVFLSVVAERLSKGQEVEVYGRGERVQNYIDVRDIAEAICLAVKNKPQGLYLLAGPEAVSNRSVVECCKRVLESDSQIVFGMHEDPEESVQWIVSYRKAEDTFGYRPRYTFEDTVRWICEEMI